MSQDTTSTRYQELLADPAAAEFRAWCAQAGPAIAAEALLDVARAVDPAPAWSWRLTNAAWLPIAVRDAMTQRLDSLA